MYPPRARTIRIDGAIEHYEGEDFIIVVSYTSQTWKWAKGRQYCRNVVGSDYYSINTFDKMSKIHKMGWENNFSNDKVKAFIGLNDDDDDGMWEWVKGDPTYDFFYWRRQKEGDIYALIRFDIFGAGWDTAAKKSKANALVCAHR